MDDFQGWIMLSRRLRSWGWFKDSCTLHVWIFLLLSASYRDSIFQGIPIRRGQVVTSYTAIAERCGISVQNARTAIKHLKSTGELTGRAYPKFSVFTIVSYEKFQGCQQADQQSPNRQLTSLEEGNKEKKKNNITAAPFEGGRDWEAEIPERYRGRFPGPEEYQAFISGGDDCYQL